MKDDGLQIVVLAGAGLLFLSMMSKGTARTAAARRAAINTRTTAAVVGPNVAAGLAQLFSSSGQAAAGRAATAVSGWFTPSKTPTPAMDFGIGNGWGDDSTAGAVIAVDDDYGTWEEGVYD